MSEKVVASQKRIMFVLHFLKLVSYTNFLVKVVILYKIIKTFFFHHFYRTVYSVYSFISCAYIFAMLHIEHDGKIRLMLRH